MYRLLTASKDTYVTDKYINGVRTSGSNVGQAATLDLFKLYNETFLSLTASVSGVIERSRGLIQFDFAPLQQLTASGKLNTNDSSFKTFLSLKDVYGGQTTPSNFTLRLIPISKSWDEGRGSDVIAYRDQDACNFLTASISNGAVTLWTSGGLGASGTLGSPGLDIVTSGNLGSGLVDLTVSQVFSVGNEDLLMDVTTLTSASMAGLLPNHGWRLSFVDSQENDGTTRFVKRFGTRHVQNKALQPRLIVKYNNQLLDDTGELEFNSAQKVFFYNSENGSYANFVSGSSSITGPNCALLRLIASRSVLFTTSSFSVSHNATITHLTRSLSVISQSFSASQLVLGGVAQTGIYTSSLDLNLASNSTVFAFLSGASEQQFRYELLSPDTTQVFAKGHYFFRQTLAGNSNLRERNWVVNITNLKEVYNQEETARLRIFVEDYQADTRAYRVVTKTNSVILRNMKWRLINAFTKKVIVPFDSSATLCSTDGDGMYFDFYMADLDPGEVYEFELMITENGSDYYINNNGFRFKVTK